MPKILFTLILFSILFSCNKEVKNKDTRFTYELSRLKVEYINNRAKIIGELNENYKNYNQLIVDLSNNVQTSFLTLSKSKWADIYGNYIELQPYTFGNSVIETDLNKVKHKIDLSSINEEYIDYTAAQPNSGIINDASQYPNMSNINSLHQVGGEFNATLGFHVLEFVLWGEDTNLPGDTERTISEFASGFPNGERRRDFLRYCSSELRSDFNSLTSFSQTNNVLRNLTGEEFIVVLFDPLIDQLDYLATEIIKKPYDSQSKDDVICPHSDLSIEIIKATINSISTYINPHGENPNSVDYTLFQFIQEEKPELADLITSNLLNASNKISELNSKFEDAISDGQSRVTILAAYNSLIASKQAVLDFKAFVLTNY